MQPRKIRLRRMSGCSFCRRGSQQFHPPPEAEAQPICRAARKTKITQNFPANTLEASKQPSLPSTAYSAQQPAPSHGRRRAETGIGPESIKSTNAAVQATLTSAISPGTKPSTSSPCGAGAGSTFASIHLQSIPQSTVSKRSLNNSQPLLSRPSHGSMLISPIGPSSCCPSFCSCLFIKR